MPNGTVHATVAGIGLGLVAAHLQDVSEKEVPPPWLAGVGGAALARLPDILEPATHPHHRAFFHSIVCAGVVCAGVHRAWHWHPNTDFERALRMLTLVAGAAYLSHLALDAFTARSLPLVGR